MSRPPNSKNINPGIGARWFKHDFDARRDPKLATLRRRLGWAGVGLYWGIVEMLYESDGKIILRKEYEWEVFAEQILSNIDELKKWIEAAKELNLVIFEDGELSCPRVSRALEHYQRLSEVRAKSRQEKTNTKKKDITSHKSREDKKRVDTITTDAGASESTTPDDPPKPPEEPPPEEPKEPELHPSPNAPKRLARKREELERYPGSEEGNVWLTRSEYRRLCEDIGQLETDVLISRLEIYSSQNPKRFKQYEDHNKTLRAFRRKYLEDGKVFFSHPEAGPGYYFRRDVEQFRGAA